MWFVPRDVVFVPGSQYCVECVLENVTFPCPFDADWWLRHEYGDDYETPDHGEYYYSDSYFDVSDFYAYSSYQYSKQYGDNFYPSGQDDDGGSWKSSYDSRKD